MDSKQDAIVREIPVELKTFYRDERLELLKVVDLRQVLRANGYTLNKSTTQIASSASSGVTKMNNGKGHVLAVSKSKKKGLWLAYDYQNKQGYSAWDFMKGADTRIHPALNIVMKLQNMRRFAKTLGVLPELNKFYSLHKSLWPAVDKYEAQLNVFVESQGQSIRKPSTEINEQNEKKGYSGRQITDDGDQSTTNQFGLDI